MASAKAPEAPLSESARIAKERHRLALQEAKAQKNAQVGFFGEIALPTVPPDPAVEEPPRDEPLSEAEAFEEATGAATAADVAALAEYAGVAEEAVDWMLLEAEEAAEAAEERLTGQPIPFEALPVNGRDAEWLEQQPADAPRQRYINVDAPLPQEQSRDLKEVTAFGQEYRQPEQAQAVEEPSTSSGGTATAAQEAATAAAGAVDELPAPPQPAGFSLFGHNLFGDAVAAPSSGPLSTRFKMPPFTVLDARQGLWQDRKRAWLSLGIQSEVGRGENLLNMSDTVLEPDPVKRAEMVKARERAKKHAFGQDFVLGAQPGIDGAPGGQGKAWHTNDTGISRKLAPGGGGGGAWLGGPKTSSSDKFGRAGEEAVVTDENGNPLAPKTGTSIFDPVLTELIYSWFVPPAGFILDPFAGGSVRGIVASKLGAKYVGIELRPEQIAANEKQAETICKDDALPPTWIEGDSTNAKELVDGCLFDFLMACPPYADLEQYSDDPRDLSTMSYEAFCDAYAKIIAVGVELLKPDRFACYVIGDVRCPDGFYRGLPEFTVKAFEQAGARKYNEAVLVTSVGSLPIRVGKQFNVGRKLGKTHQNVLVFVKGDPKRAAEACNGQLELSV